MEKCIHLWIATTRLVTVHKRQVDNNRFVREPGHVDHMILVQRATVFVGRVKLLLNRNRQHHRLETSIAGNRDLTLYCEVQVVVIGSQIEHSMNRSVTAKNFPLLSSEELVIQHELEGVRTRLQSRETDTI